MGAPLVARLCGAGHEVLATDLRPERGRLALEAGARWAADAAGVAAASDLVLTALPGSPELRELVLGPGRLLEHLGGGATWVDLTSASAELGRACAERARALGVGYLDAPVGGGVQAMADGSVTLYVGGRPPVLEGAAPALRAFAGAIHHVGDNGTGYLVKLLVNLLWFSQAAATTEALLLAQRHGVPPAVMQDVLRGSAGDSAFAARHLSALLSGDYLRDFGLDRCVEELDSVERTAGLAGVPHPLTSATAELHRGALRRFGPVSGELMGPAWLEERAGTRLRS
jgi:3-hydroxyisobutyrate dehydrogenase-like beta-hydroxyacid dehydrogenase